jgi:hypothetical protein
MLSVRPVQGWLGELNAWLDMPGQAGVGSLRISLVRRLELVDWAQFTTRLKETLGNGLAPSGLALRPRLNPTL